MNREDRRMPVRTKELKLTGEWEGWTVTVRANPSLASLQKAQSTARAVEEGRLVPAFEALAEFLAGWNFVDEEGAPIPCNAEGLQALPVDLLTALMGVMAKELRRYADSIGGGKHWLRMRR